MNPKSVEHLWESLESFEWSTMLGKGLKMGVQRQEVNGATGAGGGGWDWLTRGLKKETGDKKVQKEKRKEGGAQRCVESICVRKIGGQSHKMIGGEGGRGIIGPQRERGYAFSTVPNFCREANLENGIGGGGESVPEGERCESLA